MHCLLLLALVFVAMGQKVADFFTTQQSGQGTYYAGKPDGAGHCSIVPPPAFQNGIQTIAMNALQYASGDKSATCGMCIKYWGVGTGSGGNPFPVGEANAVLAVVTDECPECPVGNIDVNKQPGDGRFEIKWIAVPCPVQGGLQYKWEGSHEWFIKLQVRNSKVPVKNVEFQFAANGPWYTGERQPDNHWQCSTCKYPVPSPFTVRVTGSDDSSVIDRVTGFTGVTSGLNNVQIGGAVKPVSAPVAEPKAPVAEPKASPVAQPVAEPKASPTGGSSAPCAGVNYAHDSEWWIEVNAPVGKTVKVKCNVGAANAKTIDCVEQFGKYQCNPGSSACGKNREAVVAGTSCALDVAAQPVAQPKAPVAEPKAPVAEPKAPVAQPKAPVAEPKAAPVATASCAGVSYAHDSDWWVEINAGAAKTVSVKCSDRTISCVPNWGKFQCAPGNSACAKPRSAIVDGANCPLPSGARLEEDSPSSGFPAGAIAGIVIGAIVLVALIAGAVFYFRRPKPQEERF